MSKGKIFGLIIVLVAFGAGIYFGQSTGAVTVITQSAGASYAGGFKADTNALSPTVARRTTAGVVHIVKDGDSI